MEESVCPKCGTPNPGRKKYCENCGFMFPEETITHTENNPVPETAVIEVPQQNSLPLTDATIQPGIQPQMSGPVQQGMPVQGSIPQQSVMQPQMNGMMQTGMQGGMNAGMNGGMNGMPVQPPVQAPKKKGGAAAVVIIFLLLLLAGGGAAAYFLLGTGGGKAKEIEVSKTSITIEEGETFQIDITNYDDLGNVTLNYASDDTDIVEIVKEYDDGFDIEGIEKGRAKITISGGKYDDVIISVKVTESKDSAGSNSGHSSSSDAGQALSDIDIPDDTESDPQSEPEPDAEEPTQDTPVQTGEMPDGIDANSDGSYNLWSYGTSTIVGKVYVLPGYTLDNHYSSANTIFCDSDTLSGIYYSCYGEMPYDEWAWLELGETPEDSTNFSMTTHDLGLSCDGAKICYAERINDANKFGEEEMYYIYYSYYCPDGGYTDYVTIELYPEQAANWSKQDYQDFARAVFGL